MIWLFEVNSADLIEILVFLFRSNLLPKYFYENSILFSDMFQFMDFRNSHSLTQSYKLAVPQIRLQCDKIHVAKNFSQSKLWNLFSIMSSSIEKCPFCAAPISAANDQF